ncbi:hypothetical protein GCM10020219_101060 [Nonomuraea dietziae]
MRGPSSLLSGAVAGIPIGIGRGLHPQGLGSATSSAQLAEKELRLNLAGTFKGDIASAVTTNVFTRLE